MSEQEPKSDPLTTTIESIAPERLDAMKEDLFKNLEKSGTKHVEAATKFQAGLDKVVDVLLILVLKFGRATAVLIVLGVLNIICLTVNVVATVQLTTLRVQVRDLMNQQEDFARSQKRIEKTTSETKQDVATTSKKVAESNARVETAVEAAPKVEVDTKTGKAKLVVSVPKIKAKPAASSPTKPDGRKIIVNLE